MNLPGLHINLLSLVQRTEHGELRGALIFQYHGESHKAWRWEGNVKIIKSTPVDAGSEQRQHPDVHADVFPTWSFPTEGSNAPVELQATSSAPRLHLRALRMRRENCRLPPFKLRIEPHNKTGPWNKTFPCAGCRHQAKWSRADGGEINGAIFLL